MISSYSHGLSKASRAGIVLLKEELKVGAGDSPREVAVWPAWSPHAQPMDFCCFTHSGEWVRSPQRHVEVLPPCTGECELTWKSGLCRHNRVKMSSHCIRMGAHSMTGILIVRGQFGHRH